MLSLFTGVRIGDPGASGGRGRVRGGSHLSPCLAPGSPSCLHSHTLPRRDGSLAVLSSASRGSSAAADDKVRFTFRFPPCLSSLFALDRCLTRLLPGPIAFGSDSTVVWP